MLHWQNKLNHVQWIDRRAINRSSQGFIYLTLRYGTLRRMEITNYIITDV